MNIDFQILISTENANKVKLVIHEIKRYRYIYFDRYAIGMNKNVSPSKNNLKCYCFCNIPKSKAMPQCYTDCLNKKKPC